MKFLVPIYSCLQNPRLGGLLTPDPRSLCPLSSTEFVEPPSPEQNSWVRHWSVRFSRNSKPFIKRNRHFRVHINKLHFSNVAQMNPVHQHTNSL